MNGIQWRVIYVHPASECLIDRSGQRTVATTDPKNRIVSVSCNISGAFKWRVLVHELAHCAMISYGLIEYIHSMVKAQYWIDTEEMICNFLADYGFEIFKIAQNIF